MHGRDKVLKVVVIFTILEWLNYSGTETTAGSNATKFRTIIGDDCQPLLDAFHALWTSTHRPTTCHSAAQFTYGPCIIQSVNWNQERKNVTWFSENLVHRRHTGCHLPTKVDLTRTCRPTASSPDGACCHIVQTVAADLWLRQLSLAFLKPRTLQ